MGAVPCSCLVCAWTGWCDAAKAPPCPSCGGEVVQNMMLGGRLPGHAKVGQPPTGRWARFVLFVGALFRQKGDL